jgi:hypothetical protein
MSGVPLLALPNIRTSVGCSVSPAPTKQRSRALTQNCSRPEFVIYAFARDVVTGGPEGRSVVKVLLHHTNCGISGCYHNAPGLLSKHMGVAESELEKLEIDDPYKAVAVDVAALRANPNLPANLAVSGLVYDVQTGLVETVVPAAALRSE